MVMGNSPWSVTASVSPRPATARVRIILMDNWKRSSQLAAAEQEYVTAEMERLQLVCERNRMAKHEYVRALSAAWLRSVDALEIVTALRSAEAAARLNQAAEGLEPA